MVLSLCTEKQAIVKFMKGHCSVHADRLMSSLEWLSPLLLPLEYIFEP